MIIKPIFYLMSINGNVFIVLVNYNNCDGNDIVEIMWS